MSDSAALLQQVLPALLPRLRRVALSLVREPSRADDLAQLTIERVLARAHHWHPPPEGATAAQQEAALRIWTFGLMKDAWMEERRAARRGRGLLVPNASPASDKPHSTTGQRLSIPAAVDRLPAEQQLAVAMVLVEGLSYADAAQALGTSVGTLASRLSRGREALAGMLYETPSIATSFEDAQVQAFVDGELDAESSARLAAQVRVDLALAQRVARERALRARLTREFSAVLHEPVPVRLTEALQGKGTPHPVARRGAPGPWWWIATAVAVATAWWMGWRMPQRVEAPIAAGATGLEAAGALADALSRRLSAEGSTEHGVLVSLSFKAGDGRYCRTFSLESGVDGLACRDADAWQIVATGSAPDANARLASSELSPAVLAAMFRWQAGDALTREQERAVRDNGWH